MGRLLRHGFALVAVPLLLTAGCSKDASTTGSAGRTTTVAGDPSTTTAAPPTSTTTPTTVASTTTTRATTATTAVGGTTTPAPSGPLVATGSGWRLTVTAPVGEARVGSSMTVCYEIGGTSREPVVVLEITALPAGSATGATPIRVDGSVGRGSARVPMTGVPPGVYHIRVQLIANGERLDGVAVTVPSVTLAPDIPPATCP